MGQRLVVGRSVESLTERGWGHRGTVQPMGGQRVQRRRVVVWGTGNVGRPAIRAAVAHRDLELVGVVVSDPAKVGVDAGTLAGLAPIGVTATDDAASVVPGVDAVIYTATADTRPGAALDDLEWCLRSGANVLSTSFYPLAHPPTVPGGLAERIGTACAAGGSSVFVSGIDPGWVVDVLPALVATVSANVTEIRIQELFDYSLYDQPDVVRNVIGFGRSLDELPVMLHDGSLRYVWEPALRNLADLLGVEVEAVTTSVERCALETDVDTDAMGRFDAGTQGAFRFEVTATVAGRPLLVVDHVTRIHPECAPQWPRPASPGGEHKVVVSGNPHLEVTVHGIEHDEPGAAGGGNAVAANRLVNAVGAVCDAPTGIVGPMDLPAPDPSAQLVLD